MAKAKTKPEINVLIDSDVARRIRQHARSHMKTEVCGVLIGPRRDDHVIEVTGCIAGVNASQAGTHVTFTQDTWEHVYKIKDTDFPDDRIVGWYHSHPGFGVFLSDHDTFIHKNFFSAQDQIAWVYDPHSDEEGCFGWSEQRIERIATLKMLDTRGGKCISEEPRPEPVILVEDDEREDERPRAMEPSSTRTTDILEDESKQFQLATTLLSHLAVLLLGALLTWYLFPRVALFAVPFDPQTGQQLGPPREIRPDSGKTSQPGAQTPQAGDSQSGKASDGKQR